MASSTTTDFEPTFNDLFQPDEARKISYALGDCMNDAILLQRPDSKVVWHNRVACRHLGMTSSQLLEHTPRDPGWSVIHVDGSPYPRHEHAAIRTLRSGVAVDGDIMGVRLGDEPVRWLRMVTTPIKLDGEGHVIAVFTDITKEFENGQALRSTMNALQSRLFPRTVPSIDGFRFSATYRGLGTADSVGGDFYGTHVDGPGNLSFFIGDVGESGKAPAGVSSVARTSLRALGPFIDDPSAMLSRLETIVAEDDIESVLSILHGRVQRRGDRVVLSVASGGHPLPILVRDRQAIEIGSQSAMIGMSEQPRRTTTECELYPGDRVVMYTDGLTDGLRPRLSTSDLLDRVPTTGSIEQITEMLGRLVEAFRDDVADDTAIIGFEVE